MRLSYKIISLLLAFQLLLISVGYSIYRHECHKTGEVTYSFSKVECDHHQKEATQKKKEEEPKQACCKHHSNSCHKEKAGENKGKCCSETVAYIHLDVKHYQAGAEQFEIQPFLLPSLEKAFGASIPNLEEIVCFTDSSPPFKRSGRQHLLIKSSYLL